MKSYLLLLTLSTHIIGFTFTVFAKDTHKSESDLNDTWKMLSQDEKAELIRFHEGINALPADERGFIRDRLERFMHMSPDRREQLKRNHEKWQQMTPEEKQEARQEFRRRRREMIEQWRTEHPDEPPPPFLRRNHDRPPHHHHHRKDQDLDGATGSNRRNFNSRDFEELGLTDDQRQKMRELRLQRRKDNEEMFAKFREQEETLKKQVEQAEAEGDQGKIRELMEQRQELMKERSEMRERYQQQMRELLTNEQEKKLLEMRVQRQKQPD